jgi:tRNA (guanine10-N2)-dimethyltransferase
MKFLIEFTGEHKLLPFAEFNGILETFNFNFDSILDSPGIGIVDSPNDLMKIVFRPALCRSISKFLFSVDDPTDDRIESAALRSIPDQVGTFAIDSRRILGYHQKLSTLGLEKLVGGAKIAQSKGKARVKMSEPDTEFKLLLSKKCYMGELLANIDRKIFNKHHGRNRVFFSPISLHPKFARAMVNLARLQPGAAVLDPFCGTGGILIEAAYCDLKVHGSDISNKMVDGSRDNLEYFKLPYEDLQKCDIEDSSGVFGKMDGIVTDPPYGRSSSTSGQELKKLYSRTFSTLAGLLREKGHLVIMLPDRDFIQLGDDFLNLKEQYSVFVHKSLTRHICVYQK